MTTLTPAGPAPEPIQIADLRQAGLSIRQIAWRLGRAPPAISRELRRNAAGRRDDRPFEAHRRAAARPAPSHRRRIETDDDRRQLVAELLAQRWSPRQINVTCGCGSQGSRGCGCVTRPPGFPIPHQLAQLPG